MKTITILLPVTFKELKECVRNKFKWIIAPKRRSHNVSVLKKLERDISGEINSGYWSNDITPYMSKELTMGFPNGRINRLINEAIKELI